MPFYSSDSLADSYSSSLRSESEPMHQPLLHREQALNADHSRETSQVSGGRSPPIIDPQGWREVDSDKPFDPARLYVETTQTPPPRRPVSNIADPTPPHLLYGGNGTSSRQLLPNKHPLFPSLFETPKWRRLLLHFITCLLAYPALMVCTLIANERTLFWTRAVISLGGGLVGVCIGLNLIALGRSYLEAATWATIIHQSMESEGGGVRLRDVVPSAFDPTSIYPAILLLWTRSRYSGTALRSRSKYDKKPWSFFIVVFLLTILSAASMPFIIGRIIQIQFSMTNQFRDYSEVTVKGDISDDDLARAAQIAPVFDDFAVTWTLSPFSSHGSLPAPVVLQFGNDTVYFSELINSQLLPNGTGFGTFGPEAVSASINVTESTAERRDDSDTMVTGNVLRFPRWGTRIRCEKIPDGSNNILPRAESSMTYLFVPRDTFSSLFNSFGLALPSNLQLPLNASSILVGNDTLPENLNIQATAKAIPFYDNGVAHSLFSQPVNDPSTAGAGFVSIEVVMVRLNTTYTPHGKFATLDDIGVPDKNGNATFIGYDAAVCLQVFEPWVLDAFNSTIGLPSTIRVVEKGAQTTDSNNFERLHGNRLESVTRGLKSTKLSDVYIIAHQNSVNQILKDNSRDAKYVPSPTVVSFTDGYNPQGYTELSANRFAQARALADASNLLPYFAGSGDIVARSFPKHTLYSAHIDTTQMVVFLAIVLVVGLIVGLCVPRLPLGVPRRGFSLYSWIAAFRGAELVGTSNDEAIRIVQKMELNDIERTMGDLRFRYAF